MSTEVLSRKDRLTELEDQIFRGFVAFYEVGEALTEIQQEKLYQDAGHKTFDDYCQARWGIKRGRAYQLIEASKVYQNLSTIVDKTEMSTIVDILPANEAQARPLANLEPSDQPKAWQKAVETAGGQPTGQQVKQAASNFRPVPKPGKMPPKIKTTTTSTPNINRSDFDAGPGIEAEFKTGEEIEMTQEEAQTALSKYDDDITCPYCYRKYKEH